MSEIIFEAKNIKKYFYPSTSFFSIGKKKKPLKAVDSVSFQLEKGKVLGVVGESGCGKSTLAKLAVNLHVPTGGEVLFQGEDLTKIKPSERILKSRDIQMIFQDPYSSLNPRFTVFSTLIEPLNEFKIGTVQSRKEKVLAILKTVGLSPRVLNRYPHEFSGGQRQRIGIARALILEPKLIVADEPVSALDVSIQSQILNLISTLKKDFGISFLFISHDLAVVQHICDEIIVMYLGKVVEKASNTLLYSNPKHPYTQALLAAVPKANFEIFGKKEFLQGEIPSPSNIPKGCSFHSRCPFSTDRCSDSAPGTYVTKEDPSHSVSCFLYDPENPLERKKHS